MKRAVVPFLALACLILLGAAGWLQVQPEWAFGQTEDVKRELVDTEELIDDRPAPQEHKVELFEPLKSDKYQTYEKIALVANVGVALAGLLYALMLVGQVKGIRRGHRGCRRLPRPCAKGPTPICSGSFAWWPC